MATAITDWRPYSQKVDNSSRQEGNFMSAAFTLLAAGPPRLAALGGAAAAGASLTASQSRFALPIGIVQSFNLTQNRSFARFWEFGSERSYFISGRTVAQVGLGRVLYNGPSLLRVMYAFYRDALLPTIIDIVPGIDDLFSKVANPHDVKIPPGFENLFLNLASDLFSQPCGLLVYLKDSDENTMGAFYLEECYVPSHSFATDAQSVVIQEQVALQPERVVPVAVNQIALFDEGLSDLLSTGV